MSIRHSPNRRKVCGSVNGRGKLNGKMGNFSNGRLPRRGRTGIDTRSFHGGKAPSVTPNFHHVIERTHVRVHYTHQRSGGIQSVQFGGQACLIVLQKARNRVVAELQLVATEF